MLNLSRSDFVVPPARAAALASNARLAVSPASRRRPDPAKGFGPTRWVRRVHALYDGIWKKPAPTAVIQCIVEG